MNIDRLSQTFIFVVLALVVDISAYDGRYSPVLRNSYSNICPKPEFQNGFIRMRLRGKYLRFECYADFTLVGLPLLLCKNGRWNSQVPICVKPGCSDLSAVDNGFIFYNNMKAAATLFCDSGYKLAGSMYSYCNGTAWDRSLGSCRRTNWTVAVACDFEVSDLCGWESEATHRLDWERSSGDASRRARKTGPTHDHTTGEPLNGHFMMVDSSQANMNETARFISPIYSTNYSKNACFRLFYHMFGDAGTLAIYVKPLSVNLREMAKQSAPFSVSGNQGNAWIEGCLDLEQQNESFQIVIQASLGMRYKSDVAIDDVQLFGGCNCNSNGTSEEPVTESDDDMFQIDSCAGRCGQDVSDSSDVGERSMIHCGCNNDCNEDNTCCPDYVELCVPDESTAADGYEDQFKFPVTPKPIGSNSCKAMEFMGIFLIILSIIMAMICFSQTSRSQISSMFRKIRPNRVDDAFGMAEDVQYLAVNDTISNFSGDNGSVASMRLP